MTDINKLIYGKDPTERIVSIEVNDGEAELFIQNEDGSITSKFVKNKFWLLSSRNLGNNWIRLKGNLHYKYGIQFEDRSDFNKVRSSLKEQDIYTIADPKENCMVNKGITYYKGLKPNEVSILSFDIETTGLDGAKEKLLLISNTYRNHKGEIERKLFAYDEYQDEGDMLCQWRDWVTDMNPSIICGHNIYGFDLPFLQARADAHGIQLLLGRDASPIKFNEYDSKFRKDGSQSYSYKKVKCYGREFVDTMFLAIKYDVGRKYESYGLKKIIEQEGIRVEGRVMYDASKIKDNYKNPVEWEKIKAYCVHDSDEALALFDLMVAPTFYMTRTVPKPFQLMIESATGSQINAVMVRSYLQDAHSIPKTTEAEEFNGAISFGCPGIFKNAFKVDVASLYPSIMLQYEVYNKEKDPNAHFLILLKTFTEERLKNKKLAKTDKYYDDLQNSQKIFINSCYGFLGASGLNFNSPEHASFVTRKGRDILIKAIEWAEGIDYETWKKNNNLEDL
jgi:DNA polymerase I